MTPDFVTKHGLEHGTDSFAIATIVRTKGTTAAKAGAKALIDAEGAIVDGWLGGGCVRGAIKTATLRAYKTCQPQLISVAPEDALTDQGVSAGDNVEGVHYARNGCPSKGTIDVFIEPHMPQPNLLIFGDSPVASALAGIAPTTGWPVETSAGDTPPTSSTPPRFIVIATQGRGDLIALKTALNMSVDYIAFVGSPKKFATLSTKLNEAGIDADAIAAIRAPAGIDIKATTPAEIALSILAELTLVKNSEGANA